MKIKSYNLVFLLAGISLSIKGMSQQGHCPLANTIERPALKPLTQQDIDNSLEHFTDNFSLSNNSIDDRIERICDPCCNLGFNLINCLITAIACKNKTKYE